MSEREFAEFWSNLEIDLRDAFGSAKQAEKAGIKNIRNRQQLVDYLRKKGWSNPEKLLNLPEDRFVHIHCGDPDSYYSQIIYTDLMYNLGKFIEDPLQYQWIQTRICDYFKCNKYPAGQVQSSL